MKEVVKHFFLVIIKSLCRLVAIIFSYNFFLYLKQIKIKVHTFWLSSEFESIDQSSVINYPIVLRGGKYISIGANVTIGKRAVLTAWEAYRGQVFLPRIIIGNGTAIGEDCHITSVDRITIGHSVLIGKKVTITDNSHGQTTSEHLKLAPASRPLFSKGAVFIESGVWIGDKVTILPGVTIGQNSVIGANALVTKDIPSNCVAGGVPARVIKTINF